MAKKPAFAGAMAIPPTPNSPFPAKYRKTASSCCFSQLKVSSFYD